MAIVGAVIGILLNVFIRLKRKKRLLMEPDMMSSFELTLKGGQIALRMFGDFGIINMSDLPISINRPHLLGYNSASRDFQFKVMPRVEKPENLFEWISVPPSSESILIGQRSCSVVIERFRVRRKPLFVWVETLEVIRIGSRRKWRWLSYLYRGKYLKSEGKLW